VGQAERTDKAGQEERDRQNGYGTGRTSQAKWDRYNGMGRTGRQNRHVDDDRGRTRLPEIRSVRTRMPK
jgi:hypothetical protein